MKHNYIKTLFYSASLLAIALPAVHGQSENDDDLITLNPFSVTGEDEGYMATTTISGTAMRTSLMNVPMSINVITSEFLDDSNVGNFAEALDYNSSITQTNRQPIGNRNAIFSIRGFRNRNNLVDGVLGGDFVPTQMIDRIEVVKGPNTLYGQSDPGGLINVITKTPQAEQSGKVTAKYGENNWIQGSVDATFRMDDDKLGVRLLFDSKTTDGWRPVDGSDSTFIGASGEYDFTENTQGIFFVGDSNTKGIPVQRATWSFEQIPTDLNGDGVIDNTVVRGVREDTARFNNTFIPRSYTTATEDNIFDQDNYYLRLGLRHKFSENHNLQYMYNYYQQELLVTFREFNTFNVNGRSDGNYTSSNSKNRSEVHTINDIIGFNTGDIRHQMLVGIRVSEDINGGNGSFRLRSINGAEAAILDDIEARTGKTFRRFLFKEDVLNNVPIWEDDVPSNEELRAFGVRTNSVDRSFEDINTYYVTNNTFLMDDRLNILTGVRHTEIEQKTLALGGAQQGLAVDDNDTNFQVGAVYRINPNLSAYVNWAEAFDPNSAVNPDTGDFFDPETSEAVELGIKFVDLFDGKLGGSATVFQIEKENVVRNDFNPVTFMTDQAFTSDESKGFELELFASPIENWDIVLGYSYIDGEVVDALSEDLEGLRLEGATPRRLTLFNSYTIPSGPLEGLRFGGGMVWADGPIQQFGTPNNRLVVEDGYTVFDFFARYPAIIADREVIFGLNIDNVTDEFFIRSRAATNEARQIIFSVSTIF